MSDDLIIVSALAILDAVGVEYMATINGKTFHNLDKEVTTVRGKVEKKKAFRTAQDRRNSAILDRDLWTSVRDLAYNQMKDMAINDELVFLNTTHNNLSNFRSAISSIMHKAHGKGSYVTQENPRTKEVKVIRLK